jgi:flagellar biosynthesis protein FlhB
MQNLSYELPPIAILLLIILILVWLVPLLFTRTGEYLRTTVRLADSEPSKLSSARFSFYWTLLWTLTWFVLFLVRYQRHSEFDGGMIGLIVVGFIFTILRYCKWAPL